MRPPPEDEPLRHLSPPELLELISELGFFGCEETLRREELGGFLACLFTSRSLFPRRPKELCQFLLQS